MLNCGLMYLWPPVLLERGNQLRALVHVSNEFGCDINIAHNEDNELSTDRQFIHPEGVFAGAF